MPPIFPPDTIITSVMKYIVDRGSSVGTATRYGLDVPGIETRGGARLTAAVQTGSGAHPPKGYRVFPGGKAAGAWR